MSSMRRTGIVLLAGASLLGGTQSRGQSVAVGPDGVKIKDKGQTVEVGPGGLVIDAGPDQAAGATLDTGAATECRSLQTLSLSGRTLEVEGVAVVARNNCTLRIVDSRIVSRGQTAIVVENNATVEISGGSVSGAQGAILIRNNGTVRATGVSFTGRVSTRNNGRFDDRGGNQFAETAAASVRPASPPASGGAGAAPATAATAFRPRRTGLPPFPPIRCSMEGEKFVLRKSRIKTSEVAVLARGACRVTIEDAVVESDDVGIDASNRAHVTIVNSEVHGGGVAIRLGNRAVVVVRDSRIHGRVEKDDLGELRDEGGNTFER